MNRRVVVVAAVFLLLMLAHATRYVPVDVRTYERTAITGEEMDVVWVWDRWRQRTCVQVLLFTGDPATSQQYRRCPAKVSAPARE